MRMGMSGVANAVQAEHGAHFTARRLVLEDLQGLAAPVMGLDHYRMRGPTFAPHPHAGFSAVSYVLENSAGSLRNRDSLNHDVVIAPGSIVWTQAGTGIVHDEFPAGVGREVHGVQIFINQSRRTKSLPPRVMHLATGEVPVVMDRELNRTRVLSGRLSGASSPLNPAEPFDLFDVQLMGTWAYPVPATRHVLVYVLSGEVDVRVGDEVRRASAFQATAARFTKPGQLQIVGSDAAHVLVLAGTDPGEPVVMHGPFIMNDSKQLAAAFDRYTRGEMGRLMPLEGTV